jgi:hypothetical protein
MGGNRHRRGRAGEAGGRESGRGATHSINGRHSVSGHPSISPNGRVLTPDLRIEECGRSEWKRADTGSAN